MVWRSRFYSWSLGQYSEAKWFINFCNFILNVMQCNSRCNKQPSSTCLPWIEPRFNCNLSCDNMPAPTSHIMARCSSALLSLLLVAFLPMVSYSASSSNTCSVDGVGQRLVSPTSVTIAWSSQCPEEKLKYFRFYLTHKEYRACDDKSKKADLLTSKEYNVSAREVIKSKE